MNTKRTAWSGVGVLGALLLLAALLALTAPCRVAQAGHPLDGEGPAPEIEQLPWLPPRPAGPVAEVLDPDPIIQDMINQVLTETVILYDGGLSGEWPVMVGGSPYTIASRYTYSGEPIEKATQYVGEHMAALGLDVEYHVWSGDTFPNVIGEISGATNPEDIYMIVAHLDDAPFGSLAPGADDNASGSTGVMIAADILSQYEWNCTLRFAFFTGEEQGLLGSFAYVDRAFSQGDEILGVLNMDMLGWNTPLSTPYFELHAESSIPATLDIANLFADVVSTYDLDLLPQIDPSGISGSDHYAFWTKGYPAILAIEDLNDFNPYYHTTADTLDKLDIPYFTDLVRANVGTFVHLNNCLVRENHGTLAGRVTDQVTGDPIAAATLEIGDLPPEMTNGQGYYTATVPAGVYTVTAGAEGYIPQVVTDVEVISSAITTLDFNLEPLITDGTLTGRVTDEDTGDPLVGATVTVDDYPPALADGAGYYTATVPAGVYSVTASAEGYMAQEVAGVEIITGTTTTLDFSLEPLMTDGTLAGRVTDADSGDPLAAATIEIGALPPEMTNGQGYYTATVPAGVYTVTASAAGYVTQTVTDVVVISATITTLDFSLEPVILDGTLTGRVADAGSGSAIAGTTVMVDGFPPAVTNDQGGYTVTLPAGVYTVTVSAAGYLTQTTGGVEIVTGMTTTLDVDLEAEGLLLDIYMYLPVIKNES